MNDFTKTFLPSINRTLETKYATQEEFLENLSNHSPTLIIKVLETLSQIPERESHFVLIQHVFSHLSARVYTEKVSLHLARKIVNLAKSMFDQENNNNNNQEIPRAFPLNSLFSYFFSKNTVTQINEGPKTSLKMESMQLVCPNDSPSTPSHLVDNLLLCSASPVLQKMCASEMKERIEGKILLPDFIGDEERRYFLFLKTKYLKKIHQKMLFLIFLN